MLYLLPTSYLASISFHLLSSTLPQNSTKSRISVGQDAALTVCGAPPARNLLTFYLVCKCWPHKLLTNERGFLFVFSTGGAMPKNHLSSCFRCAIIYFILCLHNIQPLCFPACESLAKGNDKGRVQHQHDIPLLKANAPDPIHALELKCLCGIRGMPSCYDGLPSQISSC